jgi:predicted metal-binding membrane protein
VAAWGIAEFAAMLVMWAVMMAAMMLPSVMPVISLYARVGTKRAAQNQSRQPTWPFVTGYLLAWAGFSVLATLANWGLHSGGYLTSMMGSAAPRLGGIVLIAAGVYQWTPLKNACLSHCRSPLAFLADHWREGRTGALTMGLEHGAYCVGCCWFLMALLFVLGVMNVAWIAVLTVFILVEKMVPFGKWWSRGAGAILVMWGAWLVSRP